MLQASYECVPMCVHTRACVHARACVRACVCARAHLYLQTRVRVIIYLVVDGTRPHDDSKAHEVLVHEVVRIVPPTILVCVYVCRQSTRVCVRVALKTCANGAGNGSEPSVNTERNPEWRVKVDTISGTMLGMSARRKRTCGRMYQ